MFCLKLSRQNFGALRSFDLFVIEVLPRCIKLFSTSKRFRETNKGFAVNGLPSHKKNYMDNRPFDA